MSNYRMLALAVFFTGLALFLAGIISGETKVYLAVIIPIIETTSILSMIGILLMFCGFFLWVMGAFGHAGNRASVQNSGVKTKVGGIVLIGPVPILFSNDKRLAIILMILGIVVVIAVAFIMFFLF